MAGRDWVSVGPSVGRCQVLVYTSNQSFTTRYATNYSGRCKERGSVKLAEHLGRQIVGQKRETCNSYRLLKDIFHSFSSDKKWFLLLVPTRATWRCRAERQF